MSPVLFVLALAASVAAADEPAEKPWPQKKDVVYVAATLSTISGGANPVLHGPPMEYTSTAVPACIPLKIKWSNHKKQRWFTKDPGGGQQQLDGPWPSRFHLTSSECEGALKADGEPKMVINGYSQRIVVTDAK